MPSYRVCPECAERLSPEARQCVCGWKQEKGPTRDLFHGKCTYTDGDDRCRFPGALSQAQKGDGRWLCAFHFFNGDPIHAARIVESSFKWDGKPDSYLRMRTDFQARSAMVASPGSQGVAEIPVQIRELVQRIRLQAPRKEAAQEMGTDF